jgi:hypothetical protein
MPIGPIGGVGTTDPRGAVTAANVDETVELTVDETVLTSEPMESEALRVAELGAAVADAGPPATEEPTACTRDGTGPVPTEGPTGGADSAPAGWARSAAKRKAIAIPPRAPAARSIVRRNGEQRQISAVPCMTTYRRRWNTACRQ